jgi:PAS domain S-box-containing protein
VSRATRRAGPVGPDQAVLAATRRLIVLLALPMLLLLAVLTALQYRQRMHEAQTELRLKLAQRALDLEQLVRPATDHVHDLRALMLANWNSPPDPGPALQQALQPRLHRGRPDGWSLDQATDADKARYGQVWWAVPDGSPPPDVWLKRAALFVEHARIAHQRAPGFEATWFAGTDTNTSFGYPHLPTARIVQALGTEGLTGIAPLRAQATASSQDWLKRMAPATTWWGSPDISQLHGQLVVSHGAMVIVDGAYVGEVSVDFRLDALQQRVAAWAMADGARHWIVNETSRGGDGPAEVMADSSQPLAAPAGRRWTPGSQRQSLATALAEHLPPGVSAAAAQQALQGGGAVQAAGDWWLAAARRDGAPWSVLLAQPLGPLRAAVLQSLLPNALIAAALVLMAVAGQWALSRHFVAPALRVLGYLRALSADAQAQPPRLPLRWRTWVDAVTETFRAQRELQRREHQREAFNSAIVDHALAAIVATDEAGRIVEFNPAAAAMFGLPREEALGREVTGLFPERFRAEHAAGLRQLVGGERQDFIGRRVEITALHADGREFPVEMLLWRTELDGEVHFTASMVDLTERRQAQHEIERQREALRQSEKLGAMGGLLAGVAHELNNPLAVVMGRAGLLEEKLTDPALRGDASRIREAAERCGRIVRTFLNMARSKPAERRAVNLNELARAAADMLAYACRSHDITLQLDLDESLPPFEGDADQIGQVVLNLLINAQQALAAQDGVRRVVVTTGLERPREGRAQHAWLRVADNGPGVPAAVQEQIFEPFFTTKPEGVGTGLGLAVSRSLARAHGGELRLETGAGGGACFRLSLPLGAAAAEPPTEHDPQDDPPALAQVLVVDDETDIAGLMRDMLEGAGYEVATAESGAVALEMLEMARFDAVVSDLRMPDMDGSALWRALSQRHPELQRRVLFVTGDTLSTGARRFLDETGCPSLDKPFAKGDFLRAVAALLTAD